MMPPFESNQVKTEYDLLAPDGSEIRLLHSLSGASVVHCALPVGAVSTPVTHRTVEEVWFFLAGEGQVWRKQDERELVLDVRSGLSLTMPFGTAVSVPQHGRGPAGIHHRHDAALARRGRGELWWMQDGGTC